MATAGSVDQVLKLVRDAVTPLMTAREELAAELATYLTAQDSEIREVGVEDLVLASCRSNVTVILDYLARGVPLQSTAPSAEILGYTRTMVRRGLSLDSVTRGYRSGTGFLIGRWIDHIGSLKLDSDMAVALIKQGSTYFWGWLEMIDQQLASEYRAEAARLSLERSQARLADIREIVSGHDSDFERASSRLGYRLAGRHLAIVLYDPTEGSARGEVLDAALRFVIGKLDVATRLAVHADTRTMWCWLQWSSDRDVHVPQPPEPVLIGVGRPAVGGDGFRRGHSDAVDAVRVALLAAWPTPRVVNYEDVGVLALCTADPDRARDFVRTELGALAGSDAISRRQRATLMAFYQSNSNFRATSTRLGLHHNTVRYRIEQIAHRLGKDVQKRTTAMELALQMADRLGMAEVRVGPPA